MARSVKVRRRVRRAARSRRGAAVFEMALILTPLLLLTLGVFDLGVAVFRYHILAEAARHGARSAIVHGEFANLSTPWGPAQITSPASATGIPIVAKIRPALVGCKLDETQVTVDWLEGSNEFGKPVRVTITSKYRPVLAKMTGLGEITLSAKSTMRIAH